MPFVFIISPPYCSVRLFSNKVRTVMFTVCAIYEMSRMEDMSSAGAKEADDNF